MKFFALAVSVAVIFWEMPLLAQELKTDPKTGAKYDSLSCEDSTAIKFANYFPKNSTLEMAFKSGGGKIYKYDYFPPDVWLMWKSAESKGQFYRRNIKGKKFKKPKAKLKTPFG